MSELKISIAMADDWMGAYIDGELVVEGHDLSLYDWKSVLKKFGVELDYRYVDDEWIDASGNLPKSISDVKWETSE